MKKPLTKMIVVDDDVDILKITQFSLEEMKGVSIRYCRSGQEAIQEALVFQPDFMLIDVMMPQMDGVVLVQAMRLIPALANIPVAFLTAKIQKEEIESYHKMGIMDVITKPFDPLTLGDKILKIWNKLNS